MYFLYTYNILERNLNIQYFRCIEYKINFKIVNFKVQCNICIYFVSFQPTIPDPEDKKPEDWEKPEHIPDPDATKPEDWDDEMDGEWEPPMVDNPDYKGEWQPKQLDNPNYKGAWEHPEIDNPDYTSDDKIYLRKQVCTLGFDLWQVKSGTIFDNVLITDDAEYAAKIAGEVKTTQAGEKKMKEAQDEEQRKKDEEEAKKNVDKDEEDEDKDDVSEADEDASNEHDEL